MRILALLALSTGSAWALEPAIDVGAQGGVVVFDTLDSLGAAWTNADGSRPPLTWYAMPRVGFWFNQHLGIEAESGIFGGGLRHYDNKYMGFTPRLNFAGNAMPDKPVQLIVNAGFGAFIRNVENVDAVGDIIGSAPVAGLFDVGAGLKVPLGSKGVDSNGDDKVDTWTPTSPLYLRADARGLLTFANQVPNLEGEFVHWEFTLGLGLHFDLTKDSDGDGLKDPKDGCPADPEDMDSFEDGDGCPELDNDKDGVPDASDGAPNDAEDPDNFEDADGVPDPDNDKDGFLDADDACPLKEGVETAKGCPDADGDTFRDGQDECPTVFGVAAFNGCPDTDGDGLPDPKDECPTEKGEEKAYGCPDTDGDRVPNFRDKCPDKPAAAKINPKKSDGCPSRVFVSADSIVILEKVFFDTGKATIQAKSFGLLDDVAKTLVDNPSIKKIEVQGHTDDVGEAAANEKLSQDRAASVMKYLISKGVAESSLVAKGYGESKPIADNTTTTGRADNRRVEFVILEQEASGHWEDKKE
jgi:outer membrane protein OmpA-like peptidoglycan-associated protein